MIRSPTTGDGPETDRPETIIGDLADGWTTIESPEMIRVVRGAVAGAVRGNWRTIPSDAVAAGGTAWGTDRATIPPPLTTRPLLTPPLNEREPLVDARAVVGWFAK